MSDEILNPQALNSLYESFFGQSQKAAQISPNNTLLRIRAQIPTLSQAEAAESLRKIGIDSGDDPKGEIGQMLLTSLCTLSSEPNIDI